VRGRFSNAYSENFLMLQLQNILRVDEMPLKTPTIKKLLRQLRPEELIKLAKDRKVRIPERWGKSKIVDTLSTILSVKDVTALLERKTRAKTAEGRGYEMRFRGEELEKKIVSLFESKGFECKKNVRIEGAEFDVIGKKEGGWFENDEWVFVECKNKSKVVPADFKKFLGNFNIFARKRKLDPKEVTGYFYTTGVFDAEITSQARGFPNIKLKRIKI